MCVIFHKPADVTVSETDIKNAHEINDDGFGYMYYDSVNDRIEAKKAVYKDVNKIVQKFADLEGTEACFHFRIKTHGSICNTQCHPFRVTSKKHGMEIYVMHNGTISGLNGAAGESDTQTFVNQYLHRMLKGNPWLIEDPAFKDLIEAKLGGGNKLCFMYGQGKVLKFNERLGQQHEGMWVSNKNFVPYKAPVNDYADLDYGYSGGYQTPWYKKEEQAAKKPEVQMFCGQAVSVHDDVWVTHKNDDNYYCIGKIVHLNNVCAVVRIKDRHGLETSSPFSLSTGDANHLNPGYQAVPMYRQLAAPKVEVLENEEPKKPTTDNVVSATEKFVKNSCLVSEGTLVVDAEARYSASFQDSLDTYSSGMCALDVYNMDAQGRFDFFRQNVDDSFAMFQDMLDKLVQDDIDEGTVDEGDDTVTDEQERAEMANAMMH